MAALMIQGCGSGVGKSACSPIAVCTSAPSSRVAGFGNAFRGWCTEAGLPLCTPHGLRKIGAVGAAEAGASEHELMAMFGWDDANMARIYTRKAAQKRLAASGAAKLSIVPPIVPPREKATENNALEGYWRPVGESNSCFSRERAAS